MINTPQPSRLAESRLHLLLCFIRSRLNSIAGEGSPEGVSGREISVLPPGRRIGAQLCQIFVVTCLISMEAPSFQRISPSRAWSARSGTPPTLSALATTPCRRGAYSHSRSGQSRADCSLRRCTNRKGCAFDQPRCSQIKADEESTGATRWKCDVPWHHGETAMNDPMGAGMLRAWVMLWQMGLIGLLAAVALGLGVVAFMHVVASIRDDTR